MKVPAFVLLCLLPCLALAQEPKPAAGPLTDAEKMTKFTELLTKKTLAGAFSMAGRPEAAPRQEEYNIESVSHFSGTTWTVNSRVKYGEYNVLVPIPVQIEWAGDTPMIQVTDLSIPGLGTGFTARVLLYGDRYAGTWQHGRAGGHMWGIIKDTPAAAPPEAAPPAAEEKKVEAPATGG